jgi:hypothetical protein
MRWPTSIYEQRGSLGLDNEWSKQARVVDRRRHSKKNTSSSDEMEQPMLCNTRVNARLTSCENGCASVAFWRSVHCTGCQASVSLKSLTHTFEYNSKYGLLFSVNKFVFTIFTAFIHGLFRILPALHRRRTTISYQL